MARSVRLRISSTARLVSAISCSKAGQRTDDHGVVDVLDFDHVPQEDVRLLAPLAVVKVVVIEHDTGRVDDFQPTFELYSLQLFREAWLCRHRTSLQGRVDQL